VTGRGVATDVVEAAARAYLNAVNKIVRLRDRPDTRLPHEGP
jgi:2-isopropylmalate synthase